MDIRVGAEGSLEWPGGRVRCAIGRNGICADKREGDAATPAGPPEALLARFVLEALDVTGHAPCFDRCARCDTPAPDTAAVTVEPAAGGVVCRGCGGGRYRLAATDRADLRALLAGESSRGTVVSLQVAAALLGPVAPEAAEGVVKALDLFRAPPPDAGSG